MTRPPELFPLLPTTKAIYECWAPVVAGAARPDPARRELIEVTQRAVDEGFVFPDEIYAFVTGTLAGKLTPEMLARNNPTSPHVEGGLFGYELYYARQVVTDRTRRRAQTQALERLQLQVGQTFTLLQFGEGEPLRDATLTRMQGGALLFTGTERGERRTRSCTAVEFEEVLTVTRARQARAARLPRPPGAEQPVFPVRDKETHD